MKIISEFMLKIDNMRFDNIDDFFIKKASIQSTNGISFIKCNLLKNLC